MPGRITSPIRLKQELIDGTLSSRAAGVAALPSAALAQALVQEAHGLQSAILRLAGASLAGPQQANCAALQWVVQGVP